MTMPLERQRLVRAGVQVSRRYFIRLVPVARPWAEWRQRCGVSWGPGSHVLLWYVQGGLRKRIR